MNPDRWKIVQKVFTEAAEAPLSERAAIIARGCADDAELKREVEEMLAFDTGSEEVLRQAIGGAVTEAVHGEHSRLIGTVIGPYRIKGVLGYGGMGTVYDAERADEHFKQRVAIKLVQQMAVHPQLRARLRAERQILANLDHPYIARLIDGGELQNGTPYLVLEYVDGKSIDQYCDDNKLSVHERLQLFEKVCAAVDYAHRNLVVHRDLKPQNILVTADGTPKLLDFGIAKLLNPDPAWATVAAVTRVQDRIMTPEHASPEQVLGRTITTASDVYALGALLYHLLCGRSPYAGKNSTPLALERAICIEDPPYPSSLFRKVRDGGVATEDGFEPNAVAQLRGVLAPKLRRQLSGDIDEIILKSLRKEPEQRYATAGQFADELRRYRLGEPVVARQGVRRYRIEKFVRRNILPVSMVAALVVSLATFAVFMYLKTVELEIQRDAARQEKAWAEQTSAYLANIFDAANPFSTGGREVTAKELLEQGAEDIDKKGDLMAPEVQVRLLESIGYAYLRQDVPDKAVEVLSKALAMREKMGKQDLVLAAGVLNLGDAYRAWRNPDAAAEMYARALALTRKLAPKGDHDPKTAQVIVSMARLAHSQSQLDNAEKLFLQALAIYRENYGENHAEVGSTLSDLANVMLWKQDIVRAEQYQRRALKIYELKLERTHPDYAVALGAYGQILLRKGEMKEADEKITQALEVQSKVFGPEHVRVAELLDAQAKVREHQLHYQDAIDLENKAIAIMDKAGLSQDQAAGYYQDSLAWLNMRLGRFDEAEKRARLAMSIYAHSLKSDHLYFASSEHVLGEALLGKGDLSGAEEALRKSIAICSNQEGPDSWRAARSQSTLGVVLSRMGSAKEAELLLVGSTRILESKMGADNEYAVLSRKRLQALLKAQGRERELTRLLAQSAN